ncbi:alpha-beta hydrolase superfamily lysophospholipase [Pseudomonas sp. SJZ079]|uniref:alpha/beta fold hydrolase n=1 Tax=Pseudomonas sp. SJZ079 TaxID=2572887 RepID=UPI0011991574|nr:alpha/beta hydrolase [Pseudomonas sp. SJZ079]TWC27947.1 alpha-beta hydrolase superfamily lysophospholipase [Pseudomonas sp. SJZ079]
MSGVNAKKSVVLVHGWGGSYEAVWARNGWATTLAENGFTPTAVDLLGHGTSERSHQPNDYADLASHADVQLPQGLGLVGIGYSLGCKVLLEIEARTPGRFSRIVLGGLGANIFAPEALGDDVARCLELGPQSDTPAVIRMLAEYGVQAGNDPLAIAACLRRPPNPVLTQERLSDVKCPVLLVVGDADSLAYPVDALAHALPSAQVHVLAGIDHISLPASSEFQRVAMAFLNQGKLA